MRCLFTTLHSRYVHASLALPCLAAYCGDLGTDIALREFTVHEPKESVLAALLAAEPDVVLFSVYLWNRRETLELVDALAVACPGLKIVIGGPEVSFESAEIFARHPGLTALIRGEGELPLRALLRAWVEQREPQGIPRLTIRHGAEVQTGPAGPPLANLDDIPSPFAAGLVDATRGLVYYETSRGCPYSCAFCMSALDEQVRSFSPGRIERDLGLLLARRVPVIKLVDRTFNYDAARARRILGFILAHNRDSRIHLEIGAQLLDEETFALLATAPPGMFQFEIGVQSVLPETLATIDRPVATERVEGNIRRLREMDNIHLHLDLIAGLPGESYADVAAAVDRVLALRPHHLQLEPVKLLPGSPLRDSAARLGVRFDPNPPYTVLATPELSFADLDRLRDLSRLLDLTWNDSAFAGFFDALRYICGSPAAALEELAGYWRSRDFFRRPVARRAVFERHWQYVRSRFVGDDRDLLRDRLARDLARSERIVPGKAPDLFDTDLSPDDERAVRELVRSTVEQARSDGGKVMHFAARFRHYPQHSRPVLVVFFYLTRSGAGMTVREAVVAGANS